MFWQRLLVAFALLILPLASLSAQTPEEQPAPNAQEKEQKALEQKKELEKRTFALLDEVINSASTLRLPENRALVLASAADLLWPRDEKRARALFRDAINNLNSVALKLSDKMSNDERRDFWMFASQRREIIQVVARHDADLALDLMRASRPQVAQTGDSISVDSNERSLEEGIAIQVASYDPKRAFQMAEDKLSKGFSFEMLGLLNLLNDKDTELATRLADDIIAKLRSENMAANPQAALIATMLIRLGITNKDGTTLFLGSANPVKKPFKLSERQLRDLLEMLTSAMIGGTTNLQLVTFLPSLMPEIEKQLPERVPALRRRIAEYTRSLDSLERMVVETQELVQNGTVESILEAAAQAPDKTRDMLYEQAAWKAVSRGDTERGRQIVNDYIKDAKNRERLLESFDNYALWNSMRKEKLDEVRARLALIKNKEMRASVLTQLAFIMAIKNERKIALEFLSDALPLVSLKPKNDEQLYLLLQIVRVYAMVEPTKAFEMVESLINQANDLLAAASVLNGFLMPSGMFRKGELVMTTGYSAVSMRFRNFGKQLAALALVDFNRTKAAADRLQRNEMRVMARLFIAQGVLSEQLGSGIANYDGTSFVSSQE